MGSFVHSDLKSDNILIDFDYRRSCVRSVKVIDFGSSFDFNNINDVLENTTPEYLPPEILDFIIFRNANAISA